VVPDMLLAVGHQDLRVRRTAVTAVSALAGKEAAAAALAEALKESDLAGQLETLNLLGDLGEPSTIPAIVALLNPERAVGDDGQRLRLRAVETLGRIPGSEAVKPLQELFQKKGLFKGREPVGIRIAAAKALAALNSQEARESMALAMESEPSEEVRAVLRQNLVR
jgi:HEAT repeat protein